MFNSLFVAIVLSLSFQAQALTNEREAWINKSSFDGIIFKYQYTAYDAKKAVQDEIRVNCNYTRNDKELILKELDVKIMIAADFTSPGTEITKDGQLNIRDSIKNCLDKVPGLRKNIKVPVVILLPQISIPVQQ